MPHTTTNQDSSAAYIVPIIMGIMAIIISMGIGRFSFTPLLPMMQTAVGFGEDMAGRLAGANYLGYLVGALICPFLVSPNRKLRFYRLCLLTLITSMLLTPLFNSYFLWGVLRFLVGVASAGIFVLCSSHVLNLLASVKKEALFGVMYSGLGLGIVVSTLIVTAMQSGYDWREIWTVLSVLSLIMAIPCYYHGLPSVPPNANALAVEKSTEAVFPLKLLYGAYFLEGLGYSVVATFLVRMVGLTEGLESMSNLSWVIVGAAGIPSTILWSRYAKRHSLAKAISLAFVIQAMGMMLPLFWVSPWAIIALAVSFGGTFIAIVNLTLALGREIDPAKSQQTISKLTILFGLGQIIGPVIAGIAAERTQDFTLAFFVSALVVLLGGALIILGQNRQQLSSETI